MPRRTWLDQKVGALREELAAYGMHLDRQRAGELTTDRVRAVAALMRVTEATARRYLDDDTVKDMARRMLFEFAGEQPGADLLEAPPRGTASCKRAKGYFLAGDCQKDRCMRR